MKKIRLPKLNKRTWIVVSAVVILALGFSFFFFYKQSPEAEASWWNEDWRYRKKLTIDQTKIDVDLTNFPVAVVLTSSNFTYTNAQSAGQDIRFTDANGTPLSHEIEKWNTSATSTIWVKVPSVDSEVDTTIYMYYGNGSVADGQKIAEVWDDDFVMVQHMNNTATSTGNFVDSTKYNNDGTGSGGESLVATTTGKMDGAFEFDGSNDYVSMPTDPSLSGMSQFTFSAWIFFEQLPSTVGNSATILTKRNNGDPWRSYYFNIQENWCGGIDRMYLSVTPSGGGQSAYCGNTDLATSTWYYTAVTWDGSDVHFYLNGVNDDGGVTSFTTDYLYISDGDQFINHNSFLDGLIDDVRIATIARSAAWLKADYYNGLNTLITQSSEEKGPGPVAYWGFEEGGGSNISDLSGNGHTLIASSTVWKTESECRFGKCIYFDGATSVATTTNTDELNISGSEITLTGWFKPLTQSGKKMLLNKGSYAQHWNYGFGLNNTGLLMRHNNGDKTTSNVTINTNDWHYFTAVYSGGNDYFYIDGVLVESMSDSGWSENTGVYQLTLGAAFQSGVGYSEFFHGYLDEVKIYNYARSVDQIRNDYNKNFSIALGSNEYASLSDGLVGWWKMDEASWNGTAGEVKDMSGNGLNGVSVSGANTTSSAKFNKAGSFDGSDDYVSVDYVSTLNNLNNLSIALWVYPESVTQDWIRLVRKGLHSSGGWEFVTGSGNLDIAFWHNGNEVIDTGEILTLNQWQHIAMTYDGQFVSIYLNGEFIQKAPYSASLVYTADLQIGGSSTYTRDLDGMIDELRMYKRALSPDEVRRLSEWAPDPVAYWKFDEATGQNVYSSTASSTDTPGGQGYLGTSVSEEAADPLWTLGKYGSALKFDATNAEQVYIPDPGANSVYDFTTNDSISFALWVKPSVYGDNDGFINKGSANNENWGIEWEGTGSYNRPQFYFRRDDETGWSLYRTDQTIPLNEWSHIAVSYTFGSSTSIKMYVDGVLTTGSWIEGTGAETPDNDDTGIYIGRNPWGGEEFTGSIDDVRLYRYIRNSRQVLEDMNAGKKNNPIGYWSFDEGHGQTAKDYSGSGYDITFGATTAIGTDDPIRSNIGRFNSATQFDGVNDYARASAEVSAYNFGTNDFSISFYTKFTDAKSYGGLLGQGYLDNEIGWGFYYDSTGKVTFQTRNLANISDVVSNAALNNGKWHHIVGRRENGNLRMYVDGELQTEKDSTVRDLSGSGEIFSIGARSSGNGTSFGYNAEATFDEVKVYNYALTMDELRQNLNLGQQIVLSRSTADNLSDGLLAYWPMDGNLTDVSGNGNTGTASGAVATSSAKFGQAYAIGGGTNYISAPTSDSLDSYTDKLTVAGWYYINTMPGTQAWFFDKGNNYYLRFASNGAITNYLFGINNEDYWTTGSGLVTAGQWYHITFTYDGQERKIYINGELRASKNDTGSVSTGGDFNIGNRNSHSEPMDGQVDDIKVYNRALSANEISNLAVWSPTPVGYWKLDDLSGTTSVDASGNGNTGTLTNGPVWKERGKVGGALQFDGSDDWITLASSTSLADNGSISFSFWLNPQSFTNKANPTIYNRNGQSGTSGFNWIYFSSNGTINYQYANGSAPVTKNLATAVPLNSWTHIVLVHDRITKTIKAYQNGVLMETETYTDTALPVVNGAAYISTYGNSSTNYPFQGQLDDFKIYNYALNQRQIIKEYSGGAPVGYWKFDEGEGVAVKDYSGQANHGSLVVGSGGTQSATSSAWTNGITGKINSSLNFDGNDDYVFAGANPITSTSTFSLSAWLKAGSHSNYGLAAFMGGAASGQSAYLGYVTTANVGTNNSLGGGFYGRNYGSGVSDTNWHLVTLTFSGGASGTAKLYIDGELKVTDTYTPNLASTAVYFGRANSGTAYSYNGQIDEAKIWNYELTPEEVKKEYNGGFSSFFR